ncbi:MAG TPA: hypothetical protein VF145_13385 [Chitinophagaceae bacterium]
MKWLGILFVLFSFEASAQCKTFLINPKGDTINCTDYEGKKQGYWLTRVQPNRGNPGYDEEGYYANGLKEGTWYQYSQMGDVQAIENYRWGLKDGISKYYHVTAGLIREESWKAVNPSDPYDTVDVEDPYNPGIFNKVRVKLDGKSYKHGTWKLYDPYSGALVKTEKWYMNELESERKKREALASKANSDSTSAPKTDSVKTATKVKPQEVLDFEKKNAGKKKVRVRDGRTGG